MDKKKLKIAVVSKQDAVSANGFKQFMEILEQKEEIETACIFSSSKGQKDIISGVKALRPDLLITVDLEGFEQCTLTDNISYNLLDCKQLHLLLHDKLPNEQYLNKQLSISMFFYCMGDTRFEYLGRQYPNLPYLRKLPDEEPGTALDTALQEVLREGLIENHIERTN